MPLRQYGWLVTSPQNDPWHQISVHNLISQHQFHRQRRTLKEVWICKFCPWRVKILIILFCAPQKHTKYNLILLLTLCAVGGTCMESDQVMAALLSSELAQKFSDWFIELGLMHLVQVLRIIWPCHEMSPANNDVIRQKCFRAETCLLNNIDRLFAWLVPPASQTTRQRKRCFIYMLKLKNDVWDRLRRRFIGESFGFFGVVQSFELFSVKTSDRRTRRERWRRIVTGSLFHQDDYSIRRKSILQSFYPSRLYTGCLKNYTVSQFNGQYLENEGLLSHRLKNIFLWKILGPPNRPHGSLPNEFLVQIHLKNQ